MSKMNEVLNLKRSHLLFFVNVCALRYIVLTLQLCWLIPMATIDHFDGTYIDGSFSIVDTYNHDYSKIFQEN